MNLQELREARLKQPFQPFSIRLRDGRSFPVEVPEAVAVGSKFAIVAADDDSFVMLEPTLITSLEYRANGSEKSQIQVSG